jgi:hypothetical protein
VKQSAQKKTTTDTLPPTSGTTKVTRTKSRESVPVRAVAAPTPLSISALPTGWQSPGPVVMSHYKKPTEEQRQDASDVAAELRSAASYFSDFGEQAPDPTSLASAIDVAQEWDARYAELESQARYALSMRADAWDAALRPMGRLQRRYTVVAKDDAQVVKTYPKTAAFFDARAQVAVRAAASRKKKDKAAKSMPAATAPEPALAQTEEPTAPAAPAAPAQPTKD